MHCQRLTLRAHRRATWARAFALVLFGLVTPAVASQSAKLVFARAVEAKSCGEESALRHAVARRLGYDPFVAVSANTVVAELRGEGEGLRARVFVIERGNTVGGARELASKTKQCDELMLAVALAISIAIDPESIDRVVEEPAEPTSESKEVEVAKEPAAVAKSLSASPRREPRVVIPAAPWIWRFGMGGFVATGPTPSPAWGIVGALDFGRSFWSIGLEPRWFAPSKTDAQARTGARASTSLLSLTLAPCLSANGWYACYLAEIGRLASEGEVAQPRLDVSAWVAQGLRLAYYLGDARGFGATAKIDGLVAFNRVNLVLNGSPVHETPPVLVRLGLDLNYSY